MSYSKQDTFIKLFGVGANTFFGNKNINYFESLLNKHHQFNWKDLGFKSASLVIPATVPLLILPIIIPKAYNEFKREEYFASIKLLIVIPFFVLVAAIVTPFIILANLVDLIGSLIHSLADACRPEAHPSTP